MSKKYVYLGAVMLSVMSLTVSAADIELALDASNVEIIPASQGSQNSVEISLWSINAGRVLSKVQLTSGPSPFELEHPQLTKIIGSSEFKGDDNPDLGSYDLSKMNIKIRVMGEEKSFLLEDPTCSLLLNTLYFYKYTISLAGKIDLNNLSGSTKNVTCEISRDIPLPSYVNDQPDYTKPDYTKTVIEGGNYLVPITYDFSGIKASPKDSQALSQLQTDYKIVYFMADQKTVTAAAAGYSASRLYEQGDNKKLADIQLDELNKVVRRDILVMDKENNEMFPIALYTLKTDVGDDPVAGSGLQKMNGNIIASCNNIRITPKDGGSRIKFNGTLHAPDAANGKLEPFVDNISCELVPPPSSSSLSK